MDDSSPYASPQSDNEPVRPNRLVKPAVVTWCRVYIGFMTVLYLAVMVAGILMIVFSANLADDDTDAMGFGIMGAVYGALGFIFGIAFGMGLFVPRKNWGWIYSLVLICIGFTSCCTLPACIALLIHWLKPETRTYYGKSP